jgi:Ni/Co efflux regulator RcnB
MKKLIVLSTAALMALGPMLGAAQAQNRSQGGAQIERQVKKPQAAKQQARKQQWKKGARYGGKGTRVSDHRRHNLKTPPKGYRWVRDGNDFLLIAIGSGIIASIVAGR